MIKKFSDIAWVGVGVFVSVSADGSVRLGESGLDPILAYTVGAEIEWSSSQPYWVAIAFSTKMQILRV
ncbi:unnamed protein product [Brassica oleracea]